MRVCVFVFFLSYEDAPCIMMMLLLCASCNVYCKMRRKGRVKEVTPLLPRVCVCVCESMCTAPFFLPLLRERAVVGRKEGSYIRRSARPNKHQSLPGSGRGNNRILCALLLPLFFIRLSLFIHIYLPRLLVPLTDYLYIYLFYLWA